MKLCYLDFEFNGISDPKLNLVSVSAKTTVNGEDRGLATRWLFDGPTSKEWRGFAKKFRELIAEGFVFVSYVGEAEVRSLLTLLGDDRSWIKDFKLIDLYLEYRCMLNHNNALSYGEQYINGEVIKTKPPKPKWQASAMSDEEDDDLHHKPSFSLAAATFKLLGEKIDAEEKNAVRDIIIRSDRKEIEAAKERILIYNESDIKYLRELLLKVIAFFKSKGISSKAWLEHALTRGDYSFRTALMVEKGYPINHEKLSMFMKNTAGILKAAAEDCLEVAPDVKAFRYDTKKDRYVVFEKAIREWVESESKPYWRLTDKGKKSLSKDAFSDWYSSESPGFAGAYCRYLKTKQSLNGFLPGVTKGKKVFSDFIGSDKRVRPYFGIYGSQSSRSQPAATGFIPLKAHWMRNFIEAPKDYAVCGLDFASQEFLVAAIMSQDQNMISAYASGDVYLAFAKLAGLVPQDATKDSHKKMRDVCKALVLGISYDMSAKGLAPRLSASGETYTEEKAQELIDTFYETYSDYADWKKEILEEYEDNGRLMLSDGWTMWGDNINHRSVGNFPVQGTGAVIMREAVRLAQNAGLDVIFTLHDAIYIEFKAVEVEAIETLRDAMLQAFENVMSKYGKTIPIRVEGEAWSTAYLQEIPRKIPNVIYMPEYVDAKGKAELERYRKFFTRQELPSNNDLEPIANKSKRKGNHGFQKSRRSAQVSEVFRVQEGSSLSL